MMNISGFDSALPPFEPSPSLLRYSNPVAYTEMLDIIYKLDVDGTSEKVNNSIYGMQIDGSIDRLRRDNKFVCLRYIEPDSTIRSVFLSVLQPHQNGAKGLLEAALEQTKVSRDKMASLTTDGKASNTGRIAGLWALLEAELGHRLLTIWCYYRN